jgi:glucan phosphoethanolaminetransferase (alkaline phosphatase superfamily)
MNGEQGITRNARPAPATRLASALEVLWIVLLILPAATTASVSRIFDSNESGLFIASCWLVVAARLVFGRRAYFPATLPIVVLGAACMVADFLRGVDLLALLLQWRTFLPLETAGAARPYVWVSVVGSTVLVALCWACWRRVSSRRTSRWTLLGVLAGSLVLAVALPRTTWLRAWPLDGVLVLATSATQSRVMAQYLFPASSTVNPRDPASNWRGSRRRGAPLDETVVLVIGETIRDDYLRECHGPDRVRAVAPGALVACDVTAGSDGTDQSVPLLVSREMPGHRARVSNDATFLNALAGSGFQTWWISAQAVSIAWPDAQHAVFPNHQGQDGALLLPPLAEALGGPARLKAIVLHANNAHDPYCARYDAARAPYPGPCRTLAETPNAGNIDEVRLDYANAVDASVGFVNAVIAELDKRPQPAFLIYTPDHGENLLDDGRAIWGHARKHPTSWDTHVPAIFWANAAWRHSHASEWATLQSNLTAPLMHIDMVPTLLHAAGVDYEDPRPARIDLLGSTPRPRERVVQLSLDATITWDTLTQEAGAGARAGASIRSARSADCARSTSGTPARAPASPSPCRRS